MVPPYLLFSLKMYAPIPDITAQSSMHNGDSDMPHSLAPRQPTLKPATSDLDSIQELLLNEDFESYRPERMVTECKPLPQPFSPAQETMDIEVEWADPRKRSYQVHRETFSKWVTTLRRALEYAEPRSRKRLRTF